jgi:hypothetical protein
MRAHEDQIGAPAGTLRYIFNGNRIAENDTPKKHKMEQVSIGYFCETVYITELWRTKL